MKLQKWVAISAVVGVIATVAAWAFTNPVRVFRTTALFLGVSQKANTVHPTYDYTVSDGSNLVALALGANPSSNQVFALAIDCGSSGATLIAFDKSNSNSVTIASCAQLRTVQNRSRKASFTDSERFVGQFDVQAQGNLAGGSLMVAGRLDLDTNGCPQAVLIALDKDKEDKALDDGSDIANTDQDGKTKDVQRSGRGHLVGWLDIISGNNTNTTLVPLGHLSFRRQLDQYDAP